MNTESKPISKMTIEELTKKEEWILNGFFKYWHQYAAVYEKAAIDGKDIEFEQCEYDESGDTIKTEIHDCRCKPPEIERFDEMLSRLKKIRVAISEKKS